MAEKKPSKKSAIDEALVRQLAGLLDETGLSEIEYSTDDWHLRVAKNGGAGHVAAAAPASAPAAAAVAEKSEEEIHAEHPGVVVSPMVGTVYTSADPETPAFVKIGDDVAEGDTLVLIEAMKVFNPIKSTRAGKVSRIFVSNGTSVEFGEPLMIIE